MQPDPAKAGLRTARRVRRLAILTGAVFFAVGCATVPSDPARLLSILPDRPYRSLSLTFGGNSDTRSAQLTLLRAVSADFLPAALELGELEGAVLDGRLTRIDLAEDADDTLLLVQGDFSVFAAEWLLAQTLDMERLPRADEDRFSQRIRDSAKSLWRPVSGSAFSTAVSGAAILGPGAILLQRPTQAAATPSRTPAALSRSPYLDLDRPEQGRFRADLPLELQRYLVRSVGFSGLWSGAGYWDIDLAFLIQPEAGDRNAEPDSAARGLGSALRLFLRAAAQNGEVHNSPSELRQVLEFSTETAGAALLLRVRGLQLRSEQVEFFIEGLNQIKETSR